MASSISEQWTKWSLFALVPVVTLAPWVGDLGTVSRISLALVLAVLMWVGGSRVVTSVLILLWLLVILLLFMLARAPEAGYGLARLANWVMFVPLVAVGASAGRLRMIGAGLISAAWIQVFGVIAQIAGWMGGTWGGLLTTGSEADPQSQNWLTRYTGFVGNPNDLALVLAIAAVFAFVQIAYVGKGVKVLLAVSVLVFSAGVLSTGSRGGLVALAIGVLIGSVVYRKHHRILIMGVLLSGGIALTSLSSTARTVFESIGSISKGQDISGLERSLRWSEYYEGNDHVLFGSGFGGYAGDLRHNSGFDIHEELQRAMTIDNSWLKLFLEGGLVACLVIFLLFVVIWVSLARSIGRTGRTASKVVVLAALTAILWRSLSVDLFDINPWNALLWLTIGLAVGISRKSEATSSPDLGKVRHRVHA